MIRAYNEATVLSSSELLLIVACKNFFKQWAVVVAQLVEWSLPTTEIRILIQTSAKFYHPIVHKTR